MARDEMVTAPRRSWGLLGCVTLGCAGALLVAVLGIGSCVAYLYQGKRALDPYAEQFFTAWDAEDYAALEEMAVSSRVGTPELDTLLTRIRVRRTEWGPVVSRSQRGINFSSVPGEQTGVLTYRARFANGSGDVELHFRKESEAWRLADVQFDSDVEELEAVCQRCGHENEVGSKFCSECGAALGLEADSEGGTVEL